jgi:hypothetical protein
MPDLSLAGRSPSWTATRAGAAPMFPEFAQFRVVYVFGLMVFPSLLPIFIEVPAFSQTGLFPRMDVPENLDSFLTALLKEDEAGEVVHLDEEDRAFIDRIVRSITTGSKGIFVVLHPNDRMQYMLLNTNRAGAITLLAKVMQRTAEALEADLD